VAEVGPGLLWQTLAIQVFLLRPITGWLEAKSGDVSRWYIAGPEWRAGSKGGRYAPAGGSL